MHSAQKIVRTFPLALCCLFVLGFACLEPARNNPYDPENPNYVNRNYIVEAEILGLKDVVSIDEGRTVTLLVRLLEEPVSDSAVVVKSTLPQALTVDGGSQKNLLFTQENFNAFQEVELAAVEDNDTRNDSVFITVTSDVLETIRYPLNIADNDTQDLVVTSPGSIAEGSSGLVKFQLRQKPDGPVSVRTTSNKNLLSVQAPSGNTTTILPDAYSQEQSVVLLAGEDADKTNDEAKVTVQITGGVDDGVKHTSTFTISMPDNDTPIQLETPPESLVENNSFDITINLSEDPGREVVWALSSSHPQSAVAFPPVIAFDSADYQVQKTITVTATDDENTLAETITITLTDTSSNEETFVGTSFAFATVDDDNQAILYGGDSLVYEGGTASLQVRLLAEPTGPVTVTAVDDSPSVDLSGLPLTFTIADYDEEQTITITGLHDANETSEKVNITLSSAGLDDVMTHIDTVEDDTRIILAGTTSVVEDRTDQVTAVLSGNPGVPVTVEFSSDDTSEIEVQTASVSFTTANATIPKNVTILGASDNTDQADGSAVITATGAAGNSIPLATDTRNVTSLDNFYLTGNIVIQKHWGYIWKRCPQGAVDDATCGDSLDIGGLPDTIGTYQYCNGYPLGMPAVTCTDGGSVLTGTGSGTSEVWQTCEDLNNGAGYESLTGWRVPSILELQRMHAAADHHLALEGNPYSLGAFGSYWSNEIGGGFGNQAYVVGSASSSGLSQVDNRRYVQCITDL